MVPDDLAEIKRDKAPSTRGMQRAPGRGPAADVAAEGKISLKNAGHSDWGDRRPRRPQPEELTASDRPRSFARGETTSARSRPSEGRRGSPPWHLPCSTPKSDRGVRMSTGEDLP